MADAVGCFLEVRVHDGNTHPYGPVNGYFNGFSVNVIATTETSWDAAAMIALHELGHCVQYVQLGDAVWTARYDYPWFEFEADAMAIGWASQFGVRPEADIDTLRFFAEHYNLDPHANWDSPHGSIVGRALYGYYQLGRLVPDWDVQGV